MKERALIAIVSVIVAILLFIGISSGLPYDYYIFLRWIVAIAAIYLAYMSSEYKVQSLLILFSIIAVLFNPIIPFYLSKDTWVIFDFIAGITFISSAFILKGDETLAKI